LYLQVPLDPDFVYRSAKYLSRSCEAVDQGLGLEVQAPMPEQWFEGAMAALGDRFQDQSEEDER
jgi:hypothetical protein